MELSDTNSWFLTGMQFPCFCWFFEKTPRNILQLFQLKTGAQTQLAFSLYLGTGLGPQYLQGIYSRYHDPKSSVLRKYLGNYLRVLNGTYEKRKKKNILYHIAIFRKEIESFQNNTCRKWFTNENSTRVAPGSPGMSRTYLRTAAATVWPGQGQNHANQYPCYGTLPAKGAQKFQWLRHIYLNAEKPIIKCLLLILFSGPACICRLLFSPSAPVILCQRAR